MNRFFSVAFHPVVLVLAGLAGFGHASAQAIEPGTPAVSAQPRHVLQLSATGLAEATQDLLTLSLSTTREGTEAAAVQGQMRAVLDAALAEARRGAAAPQMEVRTGSFGIYPRYNREGKINGWQGRAELILEGQDFALIMSTAARVPGLTIGSIGFDLSRVQRARLESQAQAQAIERFKAQATEVARAFGFSGYTLREVSVQGSDSFDGPRPRMMAMKASVAAAAAEASVPVEPGKGQVRVTVSGSVQAH